MRQGAIRIAAIVEGYLPAGDCEFEVTVSKGSIKYSLHFYGQVDNWRSFGKKLSSFPLNTTDQIQFELGSHASSTYLHLCAYCCDDNGHTALGVVMSYNEDEPHRCRLEFSIPTEAASLNELGRVLSDWQVVNDSEILWEAQTS